MEAIPANSLGNHGKRYIGKPAMLRFQHLTPDSGALATQSMRGRLLHSDTIEPGLGLMLTGIVGILTLYQDCSTVLLR